MAGKMKICDRFPSQSLFAVNVCFICERGRVFLIQNKYNPAWAIQRAFVSRFVHRRMLQLKCEY